MLPELFAKRGSYGISGAAIVASGTGVAFLGLLGFEAIVEILNLLCELYFVSASVVNYLQPPAATELARLV